jgi:hypothetical protein
MFGVRVVVWSIRQDAIGCDRHYHASLDWPSL